MSPERAHSFARSPLLDARRAAQLLPRGADGAAAGPIAGREAPFRHRARDACAAAAALVGIGQARVTALVRPLHADE